MRPPRQPLESVPLLELQKLDKRVRQATSGEARRAILQGSRKNKLLALLAAKHRFSGKSEDVIQQLIDESIEKTKPQITEDLMKNVSICDIIQPTMC